MGCCDSKQAGPAQKRTQPVQKPEAKKNVAPAGGNAAAEKKTLKEMKRESVAAQTPQKSDSVKNDSFDDPSDAQQSNSSFTKEDKERVRRLSEIPAMPWGQHRDKRRSSKVNSEAIAKLIAISPRRRRKSLSALSEHQSTSHAASSHVSDKSPHQEDSTGINLEDIRHESSEATSTSSSDDSYIQHRRRRCVDPRYSNYGSLLAPELSDFEKQMHSSWSGLWESACILHAQGYFGDANKKWIEVISALEARDDVPAERLCFARCNRCAVLHDDGQYEEAAEVLRDCLRKDEPFNSKDMRDIIVHHNLALVMRDMEDVNKGKIEEHSRKAAEGLLQLYGMARTETLTAISELALVVFEQARLIESFLLARRAREGFVELFGEDHSEVGMAEGRLAEVFEVEKWYSDEDMDKEDAEVLMIKEPDEAMGAQWNGSRLEAVGEGKAADRAGLRRMIGRELRTVNGVTVLSLTHLRELLHNTCILTMWFDERQPDISELINATLPSLANIPVTQSVHTLDRSKDNGGSPRQRRRRRKHTE